MQRRDFMKFALEFAAGTAALAASARAAPLVPLGPSARQSANEDAHPALTSSDEVERLKPQEVRWGHHWHRGWYGHRRHWGWRHRHWGWRHRRWHRW